jgi:CheY-like chemotaxis protein
MTRKLNSILLVDDNEADNYFHNRVIEKSGLGCHTSIALNGLEAIDFLKEARIHREDPDLPPPPDLVLLDINMPLVNGWEFLDEYRKLPPPEGQEEVIVILTTSLNPADRTRAETLLGPGSFYPKPLTAAMLDEIRTRFFG